jgi:magnesium-transporting ATPase (P-type)
MTKRWQQIRVGQVIKIYENQYFPCDLLLLNSSSTKGVCYVETKNLDGETNLKHKKAPQKCVELASSEDEVMLNFDSAIIECDIQNEFLYKFNGTMKISENDHMIPLDVENMLMRGSSLRNTEWAYGVAIYTGHDTKVMMNSSKSQPKFSKIEKATNKYIIVGIAMQTVICILAAIIETGFDRFARSIMHIKQSYLELDVQYDFTALAADGMPKRTVDEEMLTLP